MRGTAKESNAGSQSLTWTKWEWKFLNSLLWSPCTLFLCSEGSLSYSTGLCKKAKTFKVVRAFFFFPLFPEYARVVNKHRVSMGRWVLPVCGLWCWQDSLEMIPTSWEFFFFTFKRKFINDMLHLNKSNRVISILSLLRCLSFLF